MGILDMFSSGDNSLDGQKEMLKKMLGGILPKMKKSNLKSIVLYINDKEEIDLVFLQDNILVEKEQLIKLISEANKKLISKK